MIGLFLRELGFLRGALFAILAFLLVVAPISGGPIEVSGWALVTTVIAPVMYVVMLFVVPLDMTMTRVFMSSKGDEELPRYRRIFWAECIFYVVLLIAWAPFVIRLFSG